MEAQPAAATGHDYDVLVIGTGPAGEGASMKCAKEGKRVAVVDEMEEVGGNCTHKTTIPSKTLRQAIQQLISTGDYRSIDYPGLVDRSATVIRQQVQLRQSFYERNGVAVFHGRARFEDPHTVRIAAGGTKGAGGITAAAIIIATGSRPYRPPEVDFRHPRVLDSDTVLRLTTTPRSIAIYGAGVLGCEYASIFRGLRIKVDLINTRDTLLSFLDDEITDALSYHLREQGVIIRHGEVLERVVPGDHEVAIHLRSNKVIHADVVLWAQGRTGNSDDMGLDRIGVVTDERGSIRVNDNYQTALPHVYAVGDVVGFPSLASAAYDQGRFAATHLVFGTCRERLASSIPTGIYTIPEISSVGATERELTARRVPYEVGRSLFRQLARAQITGRTVGMLKLLFHRETLEILGIHCFGDQASEIIHIGQAIFNQSPPANSLMYFINTTFNYPTMAEAYRVAALNGMNRIHRAYG
jgi:NAD(P) transhydrogenase